MTEQELKAIEERWAKWINPKSAPKTLGGDFLILLAEVRRLNRVVDKAIENLQGISREDGPCNLQGPLFRNGKPATWRAYLESEVADNVR